MSNQQKTIKVGDVLERANHLLGNEHLSQEQKDGIAILLEGVLHSTNNYEGFRYKEEYSKETEFNRHYSASKKNGPDVQYFDAVRHNQGGIR